MATTMADYEDKVSALKHKLFEEISKGTDRLQILELGLGTGPNFSYYSRPGIHILGVDPNRAMQTHATSAAQKAALQPQQLQFVTAVAESLPIPSDSVDVVIGTLVLCSVIDVRQAVAELIRVLRPGGSFLFMEHVAASDGSVTRFLQTVLDPLQQALADGCHLTRNPLLAIEMAGFTSLSSDTITVPGLGILGPHIVGRAIK